MILDSSVIIAVVLREAGFERLVSTMATTECAEVPRTRDLGGTVQIVW